jgi:hypothetical protein
VRRSSSPRSAISACATVRTSFDGELLCGELLCDRSGGLL